jgi:hypothetical protein
MARAAGAVTGRTRWGPVASIALATTLLSGCAAGESAAVDSLEGVRAATRKYQDVAVALADGYVRDPLNICETPYYLGRTGEAGVMGIHYLRRDLLGIGEDETRLDVTRAHADFLEPAILLYEPQADGSLELLAVENIVSAAAWEAAGNHEPPSFQGQPFHYTADDRGLGVKAHYDLHVWVYRENPKGRFAPYNPAATCDHHVYEMPMMHPMP